MLKPLIVFLLTVVLLGGPVLGKGGDSDGGKAGDKGGDSDGGRGGDSEGGKGGGKGGDSGGKGSDKGGDGAGGKGGGKAGESGGGTTGGNTSEGSIGGANTGGGMPGERGADAGPTGGSATGGRNAGGGGNAGGSSTAGSRNSGGGINTGAGPEAPRRDPNATASVSQGGYAGSNGGEISLPRSLTPLTTGTIGTPVRLWALAPLRFVPGTPPSMAQTCRSSIVSEARPHGAVQVDVASAGKLRLERSGAWAAPIEVRIVYERNGSLEVRQARVTCRTSQTGRVVAIR